jgi:hypothetical protein
MGIIDKDDRGLASAINSIVWRVPNSVTTFIGGSMLAAGLLSLPFYLAATIYIIAITAFFFNFRNIKPYEDDAPTSAPPGGPIAKANYQATPWSSMSCPPNLRTSPPCAPRPSR